MSKKIDKDLILTELKRVREANMYNSFGYRAITDAIKVIESIPAIDEEDDLK